MKILFTWVIICTFGVNFSFAQRKSQTDREQSDLRGAVKKVETSIVDFTLQDDAVVEKRRPWFTNSYNPDGSYSEHISYLSDGKILTDVYLYNPEGENIECRTYSSLADKALDKFQKYAHKFDSKGNKIERIVTESDGSSTARFVYKFDARGNEIEYRHFYHTGALGGKTISTYTDDGELTSKTYTNGSDSLIWKHLYTVNDQGQTIEAKTYIGEVLRYRIVTAYDGKGRIREEETSEFNAIPNQHTSHAPEPGKVVFFYDDKRKTKEKIKFNENGFAEKTTVSFFDGKDNEIETVWYESGASFEKIMLARNESPAAQRKLRGIYKGKIIYQYEYDAQNNWTKKTRFRQSEENELPNLQSAERRVISYY